MSQIRIGTGAALITLTIMLLLSGCSDPNSQNVFNPDTGQHSANWLPSSHMTAANANLSSCAACHGADFSGGISQIACGLCHMGGPTSMHPAGWLRDACFNHGTYALTNGTAACANIHCHGANLSGVTGSGPSCTQCHSPIPSSNRCGTCHGIPPNGASFPNTAGRHSVHTSTPLSYVVCGSCHDAACETHNNGTVNVLIAPIFYAKSAGTVTYNVVTLTCTKVSCHGGQTTPNWTSGTINVDSQCTTCHAYGTAEYNSFNSGRHNLHVNDKGISCTQCHDPALLAVSHFANLQTPAMEGPAWQTIYASIQYNGTTCAHPCHDPENWR